LLYGKIICSQWLLVAAMLLILRRHGLSLGDAGQRLASARLTLGVTLALLFILAVVSAILLVRLQRARPKTLTRGIGRMRILAPAFGLEMAAFTGVCLTAGVCEELLYRGWLVNLLRAATGSAWAAVVLGTILFGIGHASQGPMAMVRTAFVGLQLGALFIWVGSLVPGEVLHAGFDLLMGVAAALAISRLSSAGAEPPV
jgi:membrane protease YdiL (CAAX protease family)